MSGASIKAEISLLKHEERKTLWRLKKVLHEESSLRRALKDIQRRLQHLLSLNPN